MALTDVWLNLSAEIGVYWKGRFDLVPMSPGVYGWFYPLRLNSRRVEDFLAEVEKVQYFDAELRGRPQRDVDVQFTWETLLLRVSRQSRVKTLPSNIAAAWDAAVADEATFHQLRRAVMKASLFVPPLYVGKAQLLNVRCGQHIAGTGKNDFHRRYQVFAATAGVQARRVSDLLFACITTKAEQLSPTADDREGMEDIVEEIVKLACKPAYSVR